MLAARAQSACRAFWSMGPANSSSACDNSASKYAMVLRRPSVKPTCGFQPSSFSAQAMSGLRWRGSSCGRRTIFDASASTRHVDDRFREIDGS